MIDLMVSLRNDLLLEKETGWYLYIEIVTEVTYSIA